MSVSRVKTMGLAFMCFLSLSVSALTTYDETISVGPSNFANQWVSSNGEYIHLAQTGSDATLTNPVEEWSPTRGKVTGNQIHMPTSWLNITGTLSADGTQIHWNDAHKTVWTLIPVPALDKGLASCRALLQGAMFVEQSVIQPYLTALYSLHPGTNANAAKLLHGLAIEEMLHMTTAANALNAIGGHPQCNVNAFVPEYPITLPFINVTVNLGPMTPDQMNVFRHIEEATWDNKGKLNTIGVYYFQVAMQLEALVKKYGEKVVYIGDPKNQVGADSSMGKVPAIIDHASAMKVLSGVWAQGEGNKGDLFDTSPYSGQKQHPHYYRFTELQENKFYSPTDNGTSGLPTGKSLGIDWTKVYKFKPNPKAADFVQHTDIHKQMLEFNSCYAVLMEGMHQVFNGHPEKYNGYIMNMKQIGGLVQKLMSTPNPDAAGMMVGPPWEWMDISSPTAPKCASFAKQGAEHPHHHHY